MKNINDFITTNFEDNISYIEQNHPELFSKLSALESAIENGYYAQRYELVHENDNFDVFEKSTNRYLYSKDSSNHASLASKSIYFSLKDNIFETFHRHSFSDEDLNFYEKEAPFSHQMSGFAPIIKYTQDNQKDRTFKSMHKFIFFGIGLGLHITSIHEKISSKVYFLVEDDLELFRLSLFTTNYKKLATDATLIFSIFQENDDFLKSADDFLNAQYYYNHYIKYFHILSHTEDKKNQFHIAATSQSHLLFFYHSLLTQYLTPLNYHFDNYRFLEKNLRLSDSKLDKKPFLLLAAGPSLQKNMPWLKKNHKNFILVALSATLSYLEKENIVPDIITHLDAFGVAKIHFDKLKSIDFIKDSILMFSSRIPQDVIAMVDRKNLFFFETGTQYKTMSLKPSAPCVGSLTYQLLLRLKVKNLYLLGLDLAIDSQTGKTHADSHEYIKTMDTKENAFDDGVIKFKDSVFNIEGNFTKKVLTTPNFNISILALNLATKHLKQNSTTIYNLSDGAKFIDTIAKEPIETDEQNTINLRPYLHKLCLDNSSSYLNDEELEMLNNKTKHSKELLEIIMDYKQLKKSSAKEYLKHLKSLLSSINSEQNIQNYEINRVLDTYCRYIIPFIFDFFNTHIIEDEQKHIDMLDGLFITHMVKIINFYNEAIASQLTKKDTQ